MPGGGVSNVGLGFTFSSRDLASGPINLLRGNFSQLRQSVRMGVPQIAASLGILAGSLAMVGVGLAGLRTSWSLAESASDFGRSMADVANISQATGETLDQLEESAIRAGIATQFAPTEAAEGLRNLASSGLQAQESMAALLPVLDFAAATGISVAEAADVTAASLNAYGLQADQAGIVTDRLMRATQLSALRAEEFSATMGRAMSTGRMFGQSMNSVVIALGSMRSAGIPATVATTSFGEAVRRVFTDDTAQRHIRRLGVEIHNAEGGFRDISDVIHEMSGAMAGMTEAEKQQIVTEVFHVRGMQAFNAVANRQATVFENGTQTILRGADAVAYYTREMENAAGTGARATETRLRTFWGALQLLGGSIQTLGTSVGMIFGDVFRPMIMAVNSVLVALITTWRSFSDRMQKGIAIGFLVASALSVIFGAAGALGAGLVLVIGLLGELAAIAALVAAGMAAAMLPIVVAIGAVVAAGYGFYRAWKTNLGGLHDFTDDWVDKIQRLWGGLREIFGGRGTAMDTIADMTDRGEDNLASFLLAIENLYHKGRRFIRGFQRGFSEAWERVGPQLTQLRESFGGFIDQTVESGTALADTANGIPQDRFEQFGATLATVLVQGFMDIAFFAVVATDALTQLMALFDSDTWRTIADIFGAIAGAIADIIWFLGRLQAIGDTLNPMSWIAGALQWSRGQDVTAVPLLNNGENIGVADRIGALTGAPQRPAESGTDRPPTSAPSGRSLTREDMEQIMERHSSRRGRPINLNNRIRVDVDGRQISEAEDRNRIEQDTLTGDLYSGEQSVWTD